MEMFKKITAGYVIQTFRKNKEGLFVCTNQEFVASDQVEYQDGQENFIDPPEFYEYQPFNMM